MFKYFSLILIAFVILVSCGDETINPTVITYETVTIGDQVWMLKNLDVSTYRNGDSIPHVSSLNEWNNLTTGAWCYYGNDPANGEIYGKLYNWYAVSDKRGLAPEGWHVPSDDEWKTLEMYLGMSQIVADSMQWRGTDEGGKLKETGTIHWISPNEGANNSSKFTALPGGYRYAGIGSFSLIRTFGLWWTSTEYGSSEALARSLVYEINKVSRGSTTKESGLSVRCIRD